jgi:hypothetical protein
MGVYRPYRQVDASLYGQILPGLGAEIAWSGRSPIRDDDESALNHDFDRYSGILHVSDPWGAGLDASVSADFWASDGPGRNDNLLTWGFDLSWKVDSKIRFTAGSQFQKVRVVYEPDSLTRISEKTDVRVMTIGLDVQPVPDLRLGVRYEMESDERFLDCDFDTLVVRACFRF